MNRMGAGPPMVPSQRRGTGVGWPPYVPPAAQGDGSGLTPWPPLQHLERGSRVSPPMAPDKGRFLVCVRIFRMQG